MEMRMQLHTLREKKGYRDGLETGRYLYACKRRLRRGRWLLRKQQDAFGEDATRFRRSRLERTNGAILNFKGDEKKFGPRRVRQYSHGRVQGERARGQLLPARLVSGWC